MQYMTLRLLPSKFPYTSGQFYFLFNQCTVGFPVSDDVDLYKLFPNGKIFWIK
jgi:hypothetical protein